MLMTHATQTTPGWKHGLSITMMTQEKFSNTLISGWAISTRCTSFKKRKDDNYFICWFLFSIQGSRSLRKYCIFSGAIHILATSLHQYAKWLNTSWTSYASLVDAALLNTRSTCKLSVIKDHTVTQLSIYNVISAVAPHSSAMHCKSAVNEGWNLDNDKINV